MAEVTETNELYAIIMLKYKLLTKYVFIKPACRNLPNKAVYGV